MTHALEKRPAIVLVIWGVFVIEMILRFFPFRLESPGSQKQFAKNYIRSGSTDIQIPDNNATMLIALIWISFNMIFWLLYTAGLFDDGIMLLLFDLRHDLHPVFLSLPVVVYEKQMLQQLPDV